MYWSDYSLPHFCGCVRVEGVVGPHQVCTRNASCCSILRKVQWWWEDGLLAECHSIDSAFRGAAGCPWKCWSFGSAAERVSFKPQTPGNSSRSWKRCPSGEWLCLISEFWAFHLPCNDVLNNDHHIHGDLGIDDHDVTCKPLWTG